MMVTAEDIDQVDPKAVTLSEGTLGYNIRAEGNHVGAIEGYPGRIEYLTVELAWEEKGIARAALNTFIDLSRKQGLSEVTTNNATHPAMEHILKTEGFEEQSDGRKWVKEI
ncbi:hypothetical protein EXE46_07340 [Halorubrum sp. GN11_10-6_MGM]|uniref:hypothetical protein n=1 Tax=Halorubrum sp. GN11_10-6_MGM TaxID=2518112 RepID=UPI0010F9253F|nr:hypothetical protein [Halorubrum sp. GN11_10-6_MGM]TKX74843.1 hypothetical protein EXE46_07340 [Halorubrum sp. GN11_10-6_MGM]